MISGHSHLQLDAISLKIHSAPSEGPVGNQSPEVFMRQLALRLHLKVMCMLLLIPTALRASWSLFHVIFIFNKCMVLWNQHTLQE